MTGNRGWGKGDSTSCHRTGDAYLRDEAGEGVSSSGQRCGAQSPGLTHVRPHTVKHEPCGESGTKRKSRTMTKGERNMCHGSGGTQNSKPSGQSPLRLDTVPGTLHRHSCSVVGLRRASHPSKSKNSIHQTTDRPMPMSPLDTRAGQFWELRLRPPSSFRETQGANHSSSQLPCWSCCSAAKLCRQHEDGHNSDGAPKATETKWAQRSSGPAIRRASVRALMCLRPLDRSAPRRIQTSPGRSKCCKVTSSQELQELLTQRWLWKPPGENSHPRVPAGGTGDRGLPREENSA